MHTEHVYGRIQRPERWTRPGTSEEADEPQEAAVAQYAEEDEVDDPASQTPTEEMDGESDAGPRRSPRLAAKEAAQQQADEGPTVDEAASALLEECPRELDGWRETVTPVSPSGWSWVESTAGDDAGPGVSDAGLSSNNAADMPLLGSPNTVELQK